MNNIVYNIDNMEFMKDIPDNYFELAIVDPPYGIGASNYKRGGQQHGKAIAKSAVYELKEWDSTIPDKKYFDELRRISKNQIIWGGNYFIDYLNNTSCFIVWDKVTGNNLYADCELAWTSFKSAVRMFVFQWKGMLQEDMKNKEIRIHPTQKPVALYKWLLTNYAKPNDKIFDSHVGSGSIRIACHELGFDFTGCELDRDYWEAQEKRYQEWLKQYNNEFYIGEDENTLFNL